MATYETASLKEDDIEELVSVIRRSRSDLPFERPPTAEEFKAFTVRYSEFRPEGSWVVRSGDDIVAYAIVIVEENRLSAGLDDAYLEFEVVPEERGKGIESMLLSLACDYVRSSGVGKSRTRCAASDSWRMDELTSDGFAEAYRVFFLTQKGRVEVREAPTPEGIGLVRRMCKDCGDDELEKIVEAFNDTFQDHFNFAPERLEVFTQYRDASDDPECFSLAMDGDDIVGVCMSQEDLTYNKENGTKWGWIGVLGVRPSYRRRGIGTWLLADGMKWVHERGMDTTHIGVYAGNEKALEMYLSAGFEKDRESIWYEKNLR